MSEKDGEPAKIANPVASTPNTPDAFLADVYAAAGKCDSPRQVACDDLMASGFSPVARRRSRCFAW